MPSSTAAGVITSHHCAKRGMEGGKKEVGGRGSDGEERREGEGGVVERQESEGEDSNEICVII